MKVLDCLGVEFAILQGFQFGNDKKKSYMFHLVKLVGQVILVNQTY
jgi:hypothetical protein